MSILDVPDIWPTASIAMKPEIILSEWRIFEVKLSDGTKITRHFVGYSVGDRAGQVSSPIKKFDPETMQGITASGRVYKLLGESGWDADAEHTWCRWKSINRITDDVDVSDCITNELVKKKNCE